MAKGWTVVRDGRLGHVKTTPRQEKKFNDIIKNTHKFTYEQLKKHGDEAYLAAVAEEDRIIEGVKEGRITKPDVVKKAEAIMAIRAKKAKAAEAKIKKNEVKTEAATE